MIRAIRSELLKVRSTHTWWLMALGLLGFTALALLFNWVEAHYELQTPDAPPADASDSEVAAYEAQMEDYNEYRTSAGIAKIGANLYTSGQFFGVMLIMVLGVLIVTNEFFHQTATTTFLTTPHRTVAILAKYIAGAIVGVIGWMVTTIPSVAVTAIFYQVKDLPGAGDWEALRSILLNLAAFVVWAVLGVGLGVLIRSQIGAVVTGTVAYLIGTFAVSMIFNLIRTYVIKEDWVETAQVIVPAVASMIMVTPGKLYEHAADQWVGAVVLIGYGLIFGVIGTLLVRKRDIS